MSRNDQVTRQWFLLQALERPGEATIEELAQSLPADYACHPRTVRRDIEALEPRFPLYTDRVDGKVRWKLVEGFSRISSVQFSATELMALVFTRDLARPLEGTPIKESLDSALAKAATALPATAQDYIQSLQGWFSAGIGPHKSYQDHRRQSISWRGRSRSTARWRCAITRRGGTNRGGARSIHITSGTPPGRCT